MALPVLLRQDLLWVISWSLCMVHHGLGTEFSAQSCSFASCPRGRVCLIHLPSGTEHLQSFQVPEPLFLCPYSKTLYQLPEYRYLFLPRREPKDDADPSANTPPGLPVPLRPYAGETLPGRQPGLPVEDRAEGECSPRYHPPPLYCRYVGSL